MSNKITFGELPLSPKIQEALEKMGFTHPTEVQAATIPLLLEAEKQDLHAQAQTGTGKTLAFGLPLLEKVDAENRTTQALVMAPTRELVTQIYDALKQVAQGTSVSIVPIYGGMPMNKQIDSLKRGAQIVIGTPGRLIDHLKRRTLKLNNLDILVLDEADIMLDMGFREDLDEVFKFTPENRQIWLFSATVKDGIKQLIRSHMSSVKTIRSTAKNAASSSTKQYLCVAPIRSRVDIIARFIEEQPDFYGIIFAPTKVKTSEIAEQLVSKGFTVNTLHGDLNQPLRNKVISGFKKRDFNILVATDVAARGIDISDLTHVINFTIPDDSESYIHRIGRTGRAGKEGTSITFASRNEMYKIKRLERMANTKLEEIAAPSVDSIVKARLKGCTNFISSALDKDSKYKESIVSIIDEFSAEEQKQALVAAFEKLFFAHIPSGDPSQDELNQPQEICIGVGSIDDVSETEMHDYLVNIGGLTDVDILKLRMLNKQTFIVIPGNKVAKFMQAIQGNYLIQRRYQVQLVESNYDEDSGRRRGGDRRGGSRGGDRRGGSRGGDRGGDRGRRSNSSSSRNKKYGSR